MCGIAGVVNLNLPLLDRENSVLQMIRSQAHRGPDSSGIFSSRISTIGMCRLAIFDPANGLQPMSTPDGRFHIVFNGAIYNFREIRHELIGRGWAFRTECDTEVLLAAYVEFGESCLGKLRGMFAFAILDSVEERLFLARDALGIKPLYFCRRTDGSFAFASELSPLVAVGFAAPEIDPFAIGRYLGWFAVPAPATIFRKIENLPPGCSIQLDGAGKIELKCWWRLPVSAVGTPAVSYRRFIESLRERLDDTIQAHSLADTSVGAFLSGGLDSTAIVALMKANGAADLKTFSVIFSEAEYSEKSSARLAADALGTVHTEYLLSGATVAGDIEKIIASIDQPSGDGINTYYASQAARLGGVKVALSGLGGDELFGGYDSFRDVPRLARFLPVWQALPGSLRRHVIGRLRNGGARAQKMADILEFGRDIHELCSLRRRVASESLRLSLLSPDARAIAQRMGVHHPRLDELVAQLENADPVQIVSAWEMRGYMTDVLLRDSDVFSMAHSLELRVPFVDRQLLEWWWNQPLEFRYPGKRVKPALADATASIVPSQIRERKKQGFHLPLAIWMKAELKPFLAETFSESSLARCPWLDAGAVRNLWDRFDRGCDPNNWGRVWSVAILVAFANRNRVCK
jgi:asparagine synthase (glutamine-hydrolysing)